MLNRWVGGIGACLGVVLGGTASAGAAPVDSPRSFEKVVTKVEARIEPATARRGETVRWQLTVEMAPGWHTYPTVQTDPQAKPYVTRLELADSAEVVAVEPLREPPSKVKSEPAAEIRELRYYEDRVVWERTLVVRPEARPGQTSVKATLRLQVCDDKGCLGPRQLVLEAPLTISDDPPVPVDPRYAAALQRAADRPPASPSSGEPADTVSAGSSSEYRATLERIRLSLEAGDSTAAVSGSRTSRSDLWAFILAGVFWGGVSLITPCVFPMIPITVSFFLKQSEKEHHRPVTMALVYCGTIVVVLTIAAVVLLSFFRLLSVNPVMNFALGLLFVFFALSLFGMYDIELPSGLARFTSAREGQGGLIGTMFMALTFTIISFACVAPFLGGFGGTTATAQFTWWERVLGGLAFSVTFAAPFFLLALFPSLLKKLPKSGSWLNSVKVVMGFLELAAALKFFRAGELVLVPKPTLFTYDLVLGMYVALALICGLYLLGLFRLPHDTPAEHIGVLRMLFGFLFVSLGLYLTPALFKHGPGGEPQRPNGTVYAWIDSFLLPEPDEDRIWSGNLDAALNQARAERLATGQRKLVFVDFTGETCTNCKINEKSVFSKPEIQELFRPYKLVQLYTDKVPNKFYPPEVRAKFGSSTTRQQEDAAANLAFQKAVFGTEQLPLYVILEPLPDGKVRVVGQYDEGKINNEAAFVNFLRAPLMEAGGQSQRGGGTGLAAR